MRGSGYGDRRDGGRYDRDGPYARGGRYGMERRDRSDRGGDRYDRGGGRYDDRYDDRRVSLE